MELANKWDVAADSYQHVFKTCQNDYNSRIMDYFKAKDMARPGSSVIDIGCGIGKYGTYFANLGCKVTLTDISPAMLRHAWENMSEYSVPWSIYRCDFDTVSLAHPMFCGGFDLAISTMSPAIYDYASIYKMSRISRSWCFVSRFASWEQPLRDAFYKSLGLEPRKPHGDMKQDIRQLLGHIEAAGYRPELCYQEYSWLDRRSPWEALRQLLPEAIGTDMEQRALKAAAALCDCDGLFNDEVNTYAAWISWRTDR